MSKVTPKNQNSNPSLFKQIAALLVLFGSLELIMVDISLLKWLLPLAGGLVLLFILWLIKFRVWSPESLIKIIVPVLFCGGGISLLLLIPSPQIAHLFSIIISLVFACIVRNLNSETIRRGQDFDGFRLNDAFLLACAFLIFSSFFGFYIFLYLRSWILAIFLPILVMMLVYQYFWHEGFLDRGVSLYIPVVGLIFAEISWALTFWSTGFISRAAVLFIFFYCFMGLVKLYVSQRLVFKTARKYLMVSVVVLALVLGTTRWFF